MANASIDLFRGLAGEVFSAGLDTAAESIEGAKVHHYNDEDDIIQRISKDWEANRITSVRLAGHSMGATAAIGVAAALATIEIPVDELVLLDLHLPRTLPHNIFRCVSVRQPHNIFLFKRFYHPDKPDDFSGDYKELNLLDVEAHHKLDDDPRVQELLIGRMSGNVNAGFFS